MRCVLGDALEIGAQQRLAAGEDEERRKIEREDLARDAQALGGRQLTRRRLVRARRDVAVGTLEIAAAREVPRDHVWHVLARRLRLRRLVPSEVYRGCPMWDSFVILRERSDRRIYAQSAQILGLIWSRSHCVLAPAPRAPWSRSARTARAT